MTEPSGSPRILIVDDEPAIRRFLRTSLTANGYLVFEAKNGEQALAGVVTHRPDVIILDFSSGESGISISMSRSVKYV